MSSSEVLIFHLHFTHFSSRCLCFHSAERADSSYRPCQRRAQNYSGYQNSKVCCAWPHSGKWETKWDWEQEQPHLISLAFPICCVAVISLQQDKGAGKENLWRNLWVEEAGAMVWMYTSMHRVLRVPFLARVLAKGNFRHTLCLKQHLSSLLWHAAALLF